MKQATLPLSLNVKKTRKAEFLAQMERVVPWAELVALIAPYYPEQGQLFFSSLVEFKDTFTKQLPRHVRNRVKTITVKTDFANLQ